MSTDMPESSTQPTSNPQGALRQLQADAGAEFMSYGDRETQLVATFGSYEAEYAVIRKGVGICHEPQRGLLQLVGADVKDFLHRMVTQDVNGMAGGASRRSLQVNVKGRIVADFVIHHGDVDTWIDTDATDLPQLEQLWDSRLFGEDLTMQNTTAQRTAIALHGPATFDLLKAVYDGEEVANLQQTPGTHHVLPIGGANITGCQIHDCGVPGVRLWVGVHDAAKLYKTLAHAVGGLDPDVADGAESGGAKRQIKGRGIGWLAYNTARIEAGTALHHIDFGPDSLPHETGKRVLDEAVSMTKGCYLGQEIVARMQNLGHPKRVIAGIRLDDDRLPVAGGQVFDVDESGQSTQDVIGAVTSSTLSPMRSQRAIAIATMKWGKHQPGQTVAVAADGDLVTAEVTALPFVGG